MGRARRARRARGVRRDAARAAFAATPRARVAAAAAARDMAAGPGTHSSHRAAETEFVLRVLSFAEAAGSGAAPPAPARFAGGLGAADAAAARALVSHFAALPAAAWRAAFCAVVGGALGDAAAVMLAASDAHGGGPAAQGLRSGVAAAAAVASSTAAAAAAGIAVRGAAPHPFLLGDADAAAAFGAGAAPLRADRAARIIY